MLETLSKGFRAARERLTGVAELNEDNIEAALRDVRMSLLEADVAFSVTKAFLQRVKEKALGKEVQLRAKAEIPMIGRHGEKTVRTVEVTPEYHFVRICEEELAALMGPVDTEIQWARRGPTVIMMAGLQGSGKTTTVGKLARWLEKTHKKRSLLVAADIYRPAAIQQLQVLGERLGTSVFTLPGKSPPEICEEAYRHAYTKGYDVVILDTAGRLAIDEPLMQELEQIKARVNPQEIFLVCDAMIGQDAVNTAKTFHERVSTTGFILTKLDGDARGGAALSIKEVTGQPIKFLGMGESLDKLEEFRPEGLASRILGMGDILGLMKDFEQVVDAEKAEADAMRMLKGKFDMQDFLEQIGIIQQMGSLKDLIEKMPFIGAQLPQGVQIDDRELVKIKAMISSMTIKERRQPELFLETSWEQVIAGGQIKGRRKVANYHAGRVKRVAKGSGRKELEVIELLQKFAMMRQMMLSMGQQTGLLGKIPGLKNLAKVKQMANLDLGSIMSATGMPQVEQRHSAPRQNVDKAREKRKRKAAKDARKSNRKKR
jgi:signal recognition particle subunit SRP54